MRMILRVRLLAAALIAGAMLAAWAPAAQGAFGVHYFFAANCSASGEKCGENEKPPTKEELFTQAAGHPNFGVSDIRFNSAPIGKAFVPEGSVEKIRIDVPAGLSTNPQAVPMCELKAYEENKCPAETLIGSNTLTVLIENAKKELENVTLPGEVFNLVPSEGLPSLFGSKVSLEPIGLKGVFARSLIKGGVEWSTDYHEYFTIEEISKALPLLETRLVFKGRIPGLKGGFSGEFLTNPTTCKPPGEATTTKLVVKSYEKETVPASYEAPFGAKECNSVPFAPTFSLFPETAQFDEPTPLTTELKIPHGLGLAAQDSSDLKTAVIALPEELTLNPSAAASLEGCTPKQIGIGTKNNVECPEASKVGTVTLELPNLPPGALTGSIFLGKPESEPITKPPYVVYLDAESKQYGLSVRLKGEVTPSEANGRLTATFAENPEAPLSNAILRFFRAGGATIAPLANPLRCGAATATATLFPFSGNAAVEKLGEFTVNNGKGGACPSPLPFTLTQTTQSQSLNAGAHTTFTLSLTRADGQQYLERVSTVLPAGLVGQIATVPLCGEPLAREGKCSSASEIGTVAVEVGAGPTPYKFAGTVSLTGPFNGAPYGLSFGVPVVAGPFNFGTVPAQVGVSVDPRTARVKIAGTLPTIVKGVPLRLRSVSVTITRSGFLSNPTNCELQATETTLTSTFGATQVLPSSPFQVGNCGALAFSPKFSAATNARTSKANGARLVTVVTQPAGQANIRSVKFQLPIQLPSRLTTLQKACLAATFEADYRHCPSGSFVGGVTVVSPTVSAPLKGPAVLVSHGGAAFPDLVFVLEGAGVRIVLTGNTEIKKGVTTTTFATLPDVPIASVHVELPTGSHSALTGNGNLCAHPVIAPTSIEGQNGAKIKLNVKLAVRGCGVSIVGHRVIGSTAYITVQTFAGGRISGSGSGLATVFRRLKRATSAATLKVPLNAAGQRRHRPFRVRLRVGFVPPRGARSQAFVTVTFR